MHPRMLHQKRMNRIRQPDRGRCFSGRHSTLRAVVGFVALVWLTGCAETGVIHVREPTGGQPGERRDIADACNPFGPGGTIAFGPGRYVVGGEGLVLSTPGVALRGDREGTTIVGCTDEELADLDMEDFWETCNGFVLAAEAQEVSDFRFESFNVALSLGEPADTGQLERRAPSFTGGQVVENNVFQGIISVSIDVNADSTVWVRDNVFRNTWHAVAMGGRNVRIVDNDISVPEPERVPMVGYPGGAIGIRPDAGGACESILVEGNRIDGHTEGVMVALFPQDVAGSSCSDITVRDNEIVMRPVHFPARDPRIGVPDDGRGGKFAIAPAILVRNVQPLVADGTLSWPESWMPEGGWPPELAMGRIHDVTVEGNRITGAVGIGIEVVDVTDSRIVDNRIEVRPASTPAERDGLGFGGNGGPGVWVQLGLLDAVNGTAVWVSEGSSRVTVRLPR
jgi:hypothetical protein